MTRLSLKNVLENTDLLEIFNDPVYITDASKRLVFFNYRYMDLCGLGPHALKKNAVCHASFEFDACRDRCVLDECLKTHMPVQLREVGAQDKEGNRLSLWLSAFPLFGGDDRVEGALVVIRDMTVEADVHGKYQVMYEREREYRNHLEDVVKERTRELADANIKLKLVNKELERLSTRDGLTDVYNHRYFIDILGALFDEARAADEPLACILIDVDYFKSINDDCNHQFGDYVLSTLSALFKTVFRASDVVARYGGDEFVVLLPRTGYDDAVGLAGELQALVRGTAFADRGFSKKVSLTIGISSYPSDRISGKDHLVKCADEALYRAKELGRDRIFCFKDMAS